MTRSEQKIGVGVAEVWWFFPKPQETIISVIYFWPNHTPQFNKQQNPLGCHSVCKNILLLVIFQFHINLQSFSQNLPHNSKVKARMKGERLRCLSAAQKQWGSCCELSYIMHLFTNRRALKQKSSNLYKTCETLMPSRERERLTQTCFLIVSLVSLSIPTQSLFACSACPVQTWIDKSSELFGKMCYFQAFAHFRVQWRMSTMSE